MKILNKRLFRGFKESFAKYIVSLLIFIVGTSLFIAIADYSDSIVQSINKLMKNSNCEDGNFQLYKPLTNEQLDNLAQYGITLENNFYINYKDPTNNTTYRIYKQRKQINLLQLRDGKLPQSDTDIVIEQHYAKSHSLNISDVLTIDGTNYQISGHGYSIDYDSLYEVGDGPYPDYSNFCLCFVNESQFTKLMNENVIQYNYSYKLGKKANDYTDEDLYDYLRKQFIKAKEINIDSDQNICNLITLIKRKDNQRIISFAHDIAINKNCTMPMGIVFFFMLSFLIATLAVSQLQKEYRIVGTLSALGYNNNQLTLNFIIIPVFVVTLGSIIGTVLGFLFAPYFMQGYINGGCITDVKPILYPYLTLYGTILPISISILVNIIVVKFALNKPIVSLLRGTVEEHKEKINLNLDKFKFRVKYQIRQFTREFSIYITLLVSLILTIFMVVFGVSLYSTLSCFKVDCEQTMDYNYKYFFRFPTTEVPSGGETAYERAFQTQFDGNKLNFTLRMIGLNENSKFIDCKSSECNADEMIISASIRDKFGWKKGDSVSLKDMESGTIHDYKVVDVMDLQYGMYVFTDINAMRNEYGLSDNYWNVIYSSEKLDVDERNLAETLTKSSSLKGASARIDSLMNVILSMCVMGILIFVGMLYIIMALMIQKYQNAICTLKILGYTHSQVCQMYLLNSLLTVIVSMGISIPLSFQMVKLIYPKIIATVLNGMQVKMPFGTLMFIIGLILVSWISIAGIYSYKLSKISAVDILRSKE